MKTPIFTQTWLLADFDPEDEFPAPTKRVEEADDDDHRDETNGREHYVEVG